MSGCRELEPWKGNLHGPACLGEKKESLARNSAPSVISRRRLRDRSIPLPRLSPPDWRKMSRRRRSPIKPGYNRISEVPGECRVTFAAQFQFTPVDHPALFSRPRRAETRATSPPRPGPPTFWSRDRSYGNFPGCKLRKFQRRSSSLSPPLEANRCSFLLQIPGRLSGSGRARSRGKRRLITAREPMARDQPVARRFLCSKGDLSRISSGKRDLTLRYARAAFASLNIDSINV